MKKIIMFVVVLGCVLSSRATIGIDLKNNNDVVYKPGGVDYVDQAFVQLIWTPSYNHLFNIAGIGGSLASGEVLLNSLTTSPAYAGTWSDQLIGLQTYGDGAVGSSINNGYIFVRIFDNSAMGFEDYYLQQYVQGPSLAEYNALDIGTIYETNGQLGGTLGNFQVIPEPATALLFILGSMGAWLVRRNNKMKADAEADA